MSAPEWLVPGAAVCEFTPSRHGSGDAADLVLTFVEKVGARDAVLVNGQRWNVNKLHKSRGNWSPSTLLISADDERVGLARKANATNRRRATARSKAEDAITALRNNQDAEAVDHLKAAIEALTPVGTEGAPQ